LARVVEGDVPMSEPVRIVVTGTESTGKTQLAQKLARHFDEPWSAEFARTFWDVHCGIAASDLEAIDRGQVASEEAAVAKANRVVFFDTDLITCVLWNDLLFPGACPPWVRTEAEHRAQRVGLYLWCDADVPFVPDPQRCFPDSIVRAQQSVRWREALRSRQLPFVEIRGPWADRERLAIAAVERVIASAP
jgi:NadR type nicotinamide-nucleotide adenylyltransferase